MKDVHEEGGEGGFAYPSQRQGGQRNSQLRGGNVVVEMPNGSEGAACLAVSSVGKSLQAGGSGSNEGKFGSYEEGIEPDQRQDRPDAKQDVHVTPVSKGIERTPQSSGLAVHR